MIVALVEDDATVLQLLAELLKAHGHDPRQVLITHDDTIETALDRLAEEKGAVIVLDLGMPVPGADLMEAARNDPRFKGVRYVVATAGFEVKATPRGPDIRKVAKPYDVPELLSAIAGS